MRSLKHMKQNPDEFYIGWQPVSPDFFAHRVKQSVLALCFLVPLIGIVLVLHQSDFSASTFEYGQVTEIEGTLITSPAPFLQLYRGTSVTGDPVYQYILLVAPGKHGVQEMLTSVETSLGHSLHGRMVKLSGFLIYHDGKTLMEVEEMEDIRDEGVARDSARLSVPYGGGSVIGEITDPKCLFGVMKPGYGKPHRSCAARCIAGGIPPVLKTVSAEGYMYYYILTGEVGRPINHEILPFVGDQVAICGEIRKIGDWLVLYRDPNKDIALVNKELTKDQAMCK